MSPKVLKDNNEPKSNNIKNIYIQKINSLMKLSKDTIGKSEIQALNQTNRKKIKKHLSQAEKNTIRLQKNRQSAKKARQRKKIYVKLLEQQQKRLTMVLQKTQNVQKMSSQFVNELCQRKKQVTKMQQHSKRKNSDSNMDKFITKIAQPKKQNIQKLQNKLYLLKQIVQQLTELSKYAYWKKRKPVKIQTENQQVNNLNEEDFFNIQEVLADIEVVQMINQEKQDINLDDLLNVPYDEQSGQNQQDKIDIKSLIQDQYETVKRCLHELQAINSQAQQMLKVASIYKKQSLYHGQDLKNQDLASFKKKNTIVPEYQIKKINTRRIDSYNSLSSANRSIMSKNRSLFSLNNYFINMEQAEMKILSVDRAIQQINRILAFKEEQQKQQRQDDFSVQKN